MGICLSVALYVAGCWATFFCLFGGKQVEIATHLKLIVMQKKARSEDMGNKM